MRDMTVRELQWLLGEKEPPCISIYMPTHRHRPGVDEDRIRYRHLVAQAGDLLAAQAGASEVKRWVQELEALSTPDFWMRQREGLAVLRSPTAKVEYSLPVPVPERVVVARSFHTRPLLSFLSTNKRFLLLALAQGRVALFQGTPYTLSPIQVDGLPADLREVLGEAQPAPGVAARPAGAVAIHYGQGGEDDQKLELTKYFRAVDQALWRFLRDERVPLVLAGVGYYHPLYRAGSRYPYLLEEGVEGSPEALELESLHAAAWRIVAAHQKDVQAELLGQLAQGLKARRASDALSEVAEAAASGRVRVLLHERAKTLWGRVDKRSGEVELREAQADADDTEVIGELCELVLAKGGEVHEVEPGRLSSQSGVSAIYRY